MKKSTAESKIYWCVFDIPSQEAKLKKLDNAAEDPNLWDDSERAQKILRSASGLRQEIIEWRSLEARALDALELARLEDSSLEDDIAAELAEIRSELDKREFRALLSGRYDRNDAILAIHAGAGGTDSQDWAQMLQRMYLRWAEAQQFGAEVLDSSEGEEAGIKSTTLAVNGPFAYGYLRTEKGVHRLVRLSPFDAAHRRHTSFALVEVLPQVEADSELVIDPSDLKIDTYRSAGAGGQHVQKNETAVRITHTPTGIVVTCQNERSQTQNRENAMRVLRARLLELKQAEQAEELASLKGEHVQAEWGSQIRSYILHPYQMVKDHRTGFETSNATAVLDGDLESLIEASLKDSLGKDSGADNSTA